MIKGLVKFMLYGIAALVLFPLAVIICSTFAGIVLCVALCAVCAIFVAPAWLVDYFGNPWLFLVYVPWIGFWAMVGICIDEKTKGRKV